MDSKVQKNEIRLKLKFLQEIKEVLHEEIDSISDQVIVFGTSALLNSKETGDTLKRVERTINLTTSCFNKLAEKISTLKNVTASVNDLDPNSQIAKYGQTLGLSQQFDTKQSLYQDLQARLDNLTEKFSVLESNVDPLLSSVHKINDDFSTFKSDIQQSVEIVEGSQKNMELLISQLSIDVGEIKASQKNEKFLARVDKLSTKLSNLDIEMQQFNAEFNKKVLAVRDSVFSVLKSYPTADLTDLRKKHDVCQADIDQLKSQIQKLVEYVKTLDSSKRGPSTSVKCRDLCGCAEEIIMLKRNFGLLCCLVAKKISLR
ncbi:hypothetical protein Btru_032754 [Bulinus truncatus]|nr:hypothetical protein Btru_032754 [Bulinus truncatus]